MSKIAMGPGDERGTSGLLAELPLEVLELLCQTLTTPERVALTSCCRALWVRLDLASSEALWGTLDVRSKERELRWKRMRTDINRHWFTASLAAWLRRRQGTAGEGPVRVLRLTGLVTDPAALLGSLGGGRLLELRLHENPAVGQQGAAALEPLRQLSRLTRLQVSWSGLAALPHALSCLIALRELVLAGSPLGGVGDASWGALAQLSGTLTRLDLSACELPCIPPPLSALGRLQDLTMAGNEDLGEVGEAAFAPLGALLALTHLSLGRCGLLGLPPQISALTNLVELGLGESYYLATGGQAALQPLMHLAGCLMRLKLGRCNLDGLPPQLSMLSVLEELSLAHNPLGAGGEAALLPLAYLGNLRRLDLRSCDLKRLPTSLSALAALEELCLAHNRGLVRGAGAALQLLQLLPTLRQLDLRNCGLRGLPSQLAALSDRGVQVDWE